MKRLILVAVAALSVLAFPIAADAKRGQGQGQAGQGDDSRSGDREQRSDQRRGSRKCKKPHAVGFVAKGSLTSFDAAAGTLTLDVKRANRHARRYIEAAGSTFTLGEARVRFVGVTDGNGSGSVDLADVLPTDKVVATGKATKPKRGCEGDIVLKLRKLQIIRPQADEAEGTDPQQPQS